MKEKRERNIGNLFVSIRKMMGLSQMEVAEKSHVTRQNISRIELGRYSPGVDVIQRIEDALGIERIYITKNNIIMAESVSFILGATDVQELYKVAKVLPCFRKTKSLFQQYGMMNTRWIMKSLKWNLTAYLLI